MKKVFICLIIYKGQFEPQFISKNEICRKDKKVRILLIRHEHEFHKDNRRKRH